ncbi:hypothetical protein G9A89_006950 [Geosiphon pyriformis]|nr:hypothetical protein G9A89_006950 [Geosiphon pyriformis]
MLVNKNQKSQFAPMVEKAIDEISEELREISLKIHSKPEIGGEEHFAHDILANYLKRKGFSVTQHAYGLETAFRAEFVYDGLSGNGRTISFNSEYDALPEIGHACGHNLIAISGVAAAIGVLNVIKSQNIAGKVVLFGTPAEENLSGKIPMIKAQAFKNVDICLMVHPAWIETLGPHYLACVEGNVEYFGKPAHAAAAPWQGKNALDAAILAYNSISVLRQQILPTSRLHAIIKNGGHAVNVIPDYTSIKFMIRTKKYPDLAILKQQVKKCFDFAANATGCQIKMSWGKECYDVIVNDHLAQRFAQHMIQYGVEYPEDEGSGMGGSTDMGNVSYEVPSIHVGYDIGTKNKIHTPEFEKDAQTEEAHFRTLRASKSLALTALDVLVDEKFFQDVRREFESVKPKL